MKLKDMSYLQLLSKRDETIRNICKTKSWKAKRDLEKYLDKLNREIGERRKTL